MHFQLTIALYIKKNHFMFNMKPITITLLLISVFSISAYSQKTLRADYAKKIRTATPKTLPQSPVSEKLTSDSEDEKLKGKVKSLIEEREGLTGVEKPIGRRHALIADFDEKGNYLKTVYFEYRGRPYSVKAYGYIDGARVSNSNYISYGDSFLVSSGTESKEEEKAKPDPRYEFKYEYKYADGKLIEMKMFFNTGSKAGRYVYNYNGNQVEELAYSIDGKLNAKYLINFDEKGNEIERIHYNVREPKTYEDSKYSFRYESFDEKGNWTKRTHSEVEIENGKEVHKPIAIEYRTITYYP
jgi:hypothetical protein